MGVAAALHRADVETLSGVPRHRQLVRRSCPWGQSGLDVMNLPAADVVSSRPKEMAAQQTFAELTLFYGLPTLGCDGCSDSVMLNERWAFDAGMHRRRLRSADRDLCQQGQGAEARPAAALRSADDDLAQRARRVMEAVITAKTLVGARQ